MDPGILSGTTEVDDATKTHAGPPRHSHPELVQFLVEELRWGSAEARPGAPDIYEEEQRVGGALRVTILWERWKEIPLEERGAVILDAYRQVVEEADYRRITRVLGVTGEEAKRLKISL